MIEVKKKAHLLQTRAKELGYELKLTHAQELVSIIYGHKTRHSALLEDKNQRTKNKLLEKRLELSKNSYISFEDLLIKEQERQAKNDSIKDYIELRFLSLTSYFVLQKESEIYEYLQILEKDGCIFSLSHSHLAISFNSNLPASFYSKKTAQETIDFLESYFIKTNV